MPFREYSRTSERKIERDRRAAAWFALGANRSAVCGDEVPRDREAQAGAARRAALVESIEDPRQVLRRDARAGVADADGDARILPARGDRHRTDFRGVAQ